jgi:hypothetical protein
MAGIIILINIIIIITCFCARMVDCTSLLHCDFQSAASGNSACHDCLNIIPVHDVKARAAIQRQIPGAADNVTR